MQFIKARYIFQTANWWISFATIEFLMKTIASRKADSIDEQKEEYVDNMIRNHKDWKWRPDKKFMADV